MSGLSALNSADTNSIYFTCKDYKTVRGVASQINDQELKAGDDWYVKGPIGMGIDVNTDGHNIIFAGGTGILVFLDIVAMMVVQNCAGTSNFFGPNFKLTLYFAAGSRDEAIGIELLEKFQQVCAHLKIEHMFSLKMRLGDSKEKGPRWDADFLEKELSPLKGNVNKVIVCGSPLMNEIFDRAFEDKMKELLQLSQKDIEIM